MLEVFIHANEVKAEILQFDEDMTHATPKLEEKLGFPLVKSIVFLVDDEPFIVIVSCKDHVSQEKLKEHLHAENIHLAEEEEVEEITGYEVGAVPPISIYGVKTIIDQKVATHPIVVAGGGKKNRLLKIPVSEIQRTAEEVQTQDVSE